MQRNISVPDWAGALAGLTAGGVALGLAQLVAGLFGPQTSPVIAVGDGVVDLTPAPVKDFAITTFGENDKTVLVWGVLVLLAVVAAVIGVLARRRVAYGMAGLAAFAVVGLVAVVTRPGASVVDVLPTLAGAAGGMWTLAWLLRRATVPAVSEAPSGQDRDEAAVMRASGGAERPAVMRESGAPQTFDRRRLLTGVAGGLVVAGAGAVVGSRLAGSRAVDLARVNVALPAPATPAKPIPAGADLRIGGLSSFITPNRDFYRVDTALVLPQVDPGTWTLRIHGMVDRPVEITYADLLRMPLTEADVTLTCVSNEVGGRLAGNARWLGVRMPEILRRAGLHADADMLLSTSADGFTCGTPVDVVMDGREALFAVAMNGEPLPVEHGFPVRQVVPGLYGYVSATKWVVDVKVTRFDRDEAYWTPRGWAAKAPIKTQSRIDVPGSGASLKPGRTTIAGVAWAQHKGVAAVEVRVDGGAWREAKLADVPGPDTWRQWSLDWDATPGSHTLQVRATDATGYTQTEQEAPPAPDGATGWHTITVSVA
ncbi:molybdopterin-dependent oxidoreductase [Nonomuraea sp. LP-02]|uniref:molybdopterin-dependent oxidoreductase n=1 Tax=Nonomuraea sp. LP-02 TaxID=3097960 RepID=UPI002E3787D4|nr:molybdopterin-dependent oxidoreductase [Nonomuraea sp. LP-02]MED7926882.1 molybdopterin-dependent oxidoreductase [Nonomuraea sp. LP-02]